MAATDQLDLGVGESADGERRPLLHWIWIGLFILAFAPTVVWLWERWTISIWYSGHGIFMPFILAYLLWERLHDDKVVDARSSPLGFLFLIPGLLMLALDTAIGTQLMAAVGLVVCLPGLSLLLLGTERTRGLIFALIIAAFMLPIPAGFVAELHMVLREITAFGTAHIIPLLGIPLSQDGTSLYIPGSNISVADACSGFSTLYAALTTGLILSHLSSSTRRGVVLIASSIVLAILCNIVRVTVLVLIVYFGSADLLDTSLHEASGIASFAVVIVLLFTIAGKETFRGRAE